MDPVLQVIQATIESAEDTAKASWPVPDIPYGAQWEFEHAMRLSHEAGILRYAGLQAVRYAQRHDEEIAQLKARLEKSIDPHDLPGILKDWREASSPNGYPSARVWCQKQGYLPDDTLPDSLATVGPISDHGNPFETAIPY